ncbi:hypothetical protein NP493_51g04062 [Ridgeia piscesae]|uniref:Alpha/beta hydrolase fold-3 domain-containing protein n=1 Tax=Ridgeia piscesae TaxID=27915 RepID=A0AAD9UJG4_RIDPI|nr:hypothetical protein NP493_51g04062 [Ridgeia piscesae]
MGWYSRDVWLRGWLCLQDLQKQYSPSRWSPKGEPEEVIKRHIDCVTAASRLAHSSLWYETSSYGDTDRQKFEVFAPETLPSDAPLFIYIHGGYWQVQTISCEVSSFMAPTLVASGTAVVAIGYDLAPTVTMEEILSQVRVGVKKILQLAKKQHSRGVYLCGHSAGAHIAAMMLTVDWTQDDPAFQHLIKGAILLSGVYDLRPLIDTTVNEPLGMTKDSAWENSPTNHVTELCARCHDVDILVVVGQYDSPEFHRQSQDFDQVFESLKATWSIRGF